MSDPTVLANFVNAPPFQSYGKGTRLIALILN